MRAECPLGDCSKGFDCSSKRETAKKVKQHVKSEHMDEVEDHAKDVKDGNADPVDLVREHLKGNL